MTGGGTGPHGGQFVKKPIPGVKHIIAVASGKGGVGKSTVSTNLAIGLSRQGLSVGLMDADIYGPSLPTMMNINGRPIANDEKKIVPLEAYGIQCMSMGFLVPDKEAIIWRGPMVMGAVRQFLHEVAWKDLDVLVIDLPPGTGDAQLTMIQTVPLSGAVIVTTPQKVAVVDAERAISMFRKLDVPVLGLIENMAWMDLPDGTRTHPFGSGGGIRTAEAYETPLLAQVPFDSRICAGGDAGIPAASRGDGPGDAFIRVAEAVGKALQSDGSENE
jgi:ATP-binding protein involved in chromosome partitioning